VKQAKVLFTEEQIRLRIEEIGATIQRDFEHRELAVIGLLEDSFVFMADLIRKIDSKVLCYFLKAEIVEDDKTVCNIKKIFYSPELDIARKSVLLVGGVLDTGITLDFLTRYVLHGGPELLKICYLIDKPKSRKIALESDYVAFSLESPESPFLVGYGLGYNNRFRNLPYIGALEAKF
jgi:hypoxanthine phosphoribosyltransferase